jgi:hypothetical protein
MFKAPGLVPSTVKNKLQWLPILLSVKAKVHMMAFKTFHDLAIPFFPNVKVGYFLPCSFCSSSGLLAFS